LWKRSDRGARFTDVVENRHGVIAVSNTGRVFGGGGYDGVISTDLVNDRNIIKRAYGVAGFHPHPAQILMIGMSTGAWAQVLANMPGVEHIKIVEINPGYLQLIRKYPQVASILRNAKVEIVIDDGRRWLVHHPDERFDVIVQNSAEHWRAHSTNLMSVEYLRLIRRHLRPNGVFHYNTTWSQDALFTGFTEFPYGIRVVNFAAVSDAPMRFDAARFLEVVREFRIDGKPVFDLTRSADRASFDSLALFATSIDRPPVDYGLERRESTLSRLTGAKTITDDNMLPEWRQLLLVK
jgi:spermidine synthase